MFLQMNFTFEKLDRERGDNYTQKILKELSLCVHAFTTAIYTCEDRAIQIQP